MTRVGVVAALPAEAAALWGKRCRVDRVQQHPAALLACSGIGADRASRAAADLVARRVVGLVSWGTAGGLAPDLRPGDLLLPTEVRSERGKRWVCNANWHSCMEAKLRHGLTVHVGTQVLSEKVVTTRAAKQRLFETNALGVDMESAAIGEVASSAGLPFIVIRAVCDPADGALPVSALAAVDADGRFRPWRFARSVLSQPSDLGGLISLWRGLRAAQRSLTRSIELIGGIEGLTSSCPSILEGAETGPFVG